MKRCWTYLLKKPNNAKWNIVQELSGEGGGQMANRPNSSPGKAGNCWWKWQWWKIRWWKSSASEDRLSSMSRWGIGHLLAETEDTLSATVSQVKWVRSCPDCAQSKQGMFLGCLHVLWSCEESSGCHELQMQWGGSCSQTQSLRVELPFNFLLTELPLWKKW